MRQSCLIKVDYRALVSRADLVYESPAEVSIEGTPIGNGCMGTTVWTTPRSVRFQINRNDLFSSDRNHAGSHGCPVDYRGPCARIEVDVGDVVFEKGDSFCQHLSVYDAECTVTGKGFRLRCFVSSARDLLVLEYDDQRSDPRDISVTVCMWRSPEVRTPLYLWPSGKWAPEEVETGTHSARYEFSEPDGKILVVQNFDETREFRDEEYHGASSVAVQVAGNDTHIENPGQAAWEPAALQWDEKPLHVDFERIRIVRGVPQARTIVVPAGNRRRTVLVASAAIQGEDGVGDRSLAALSKASEHSYEWLRNQHKQWWHEFWSRTFVHLTSEDGVADFMERVRTLHLYYAASSSRGDVPAPQGDGLIFQTEGDIPRLGTQLWHWIVESTYRPLLAADAMDVTDPYFDMYLKQLPICEKAAQQRWGVAGGAYYPETSPTDGPTLLPEDSANEFRDYFLGRTRSDTLSARTLALCQHDSHFHNICKCHHDSEEPGSRPHCAIGHIVSTGSKIALQAWWRFRCTGDTQWLRDKAYPILRGTVELYRHLVGKGEDGLYHIEGTNVMESFYLVKDSLKDLAAIRGTYPPAIRASTILEVDADLRGEWQDILHDLAPFPMGHEPESKALTWGTLADDVWSAGHFGEVNKDSGDYPSEDVWSHPIETFEVWTLETGDPKTDRIVQRLIELCPNHLKVMTGRHWRPSLVRTPIAFAMAGRGEELPAILAANFAVYRPHLANGLSTFEQGIQSMGLEHSGLITMTLQLGLMQSVSPNPGEPEIIGVFPAWPKGWDASFRLLARGGFLVTSSIRGGEVEFVEIESRLGETCRLRNPWGRLCLVSEADSALKHDDGDTLDGEILRFDTTASKSYRIVPQGVPPLAARTISPETDSGPFSYSFELPSGVTVSSTIGRSKDEPQKGLAPYVTGNRRFRIEQALITQNSETENIN